MDANLSKVPPTSSNRLPFIDGLRGVASLMVMVLHLYLTSPLYQEVPAFLHALLSHGWLGVEVFFVLSGFVMAMTLSNVVVTPRVFGRFVLRRSLRLDPPYWLTIFLNLGALELSNLLLRDRHVDVPWSASQISAHLFYVQAFLGYRHISDIFWTLTLEIQFYLLFAILLGIAQRRFGLAVPSRRLALVFGPVLLIGLAVALGLVSPPAGTGLPYWHMFFAGVLTFWWTRRVISIHVLSIALGTLALGAALAMDLKTGAAVLTCVALAVGHQTGGMQRWLGGPVMQKLGAWSYSIYLVHPLFGQKVQNLGSRLWGTSWGGGCASALFAVVATLAAAALMHRMVEQPSLALARRWAPLPRQGQVTDQVPL